MRTLRGLGPATRTGPPGEPWTRAFISDRYAFTEVDVDGRTLRLRQLDAEGQTLDAVTLTT